MMQFGSLLTQAAGEPPDRLFQRRIADPIGMTKWRWTENDSPVGRVLCRTGGIHTSSQELARFGHLFLNRGNWNGRQLVSASWVEQAARGTTPTWGPHRREPGVKVPPGKTVVFKEVFVYDHKFRPGSAFVLFCNERGHYEQGEYAGVVVK